MSGFPDLEIYLDDWSQGVAIREALAATVCAIAGAARELTVVVSRGPLAGSPPAAPQMGRIVPNLREVAGESHRK